MKGGRDRTFDEKPNRHLRNRMPIGARIRRCPAEDFMGEGGLPIVIAIRRHPVRTSMYRSRDRGPLIGHVTFRTMPV